MIFVWGLFFTNVCSAQPKVWSLNDCIDHALQHHIGIRQRELTCKKQEIQLSTDKNSRLPNLDASLGQNFSFGRGLGADNTYTNTNTSNTSLNLGTSVPLFTGFRIPRQVKLDELNLEALSQDLQKAKDDVSVQVAKAYVQVLYNREMVGVAQRQVAIDSQQVARMQAMKDNGKASEVQLAQQKAALAQSRLTATQADNNLQLALLDLSQLLELSSAEGFDVEVPVLGELTRQEVPAPMTVFDEAMGYKAEVKAEQLRLRASEMGIQLAQSSYYPQLSLSAGLGTNYYKTSGFKSGSLANQLKNNFSQYVGLSLSVPIFNRFSTRNSVRSARIDRENQLMALDNVKKTLYKEIQTVCCNAEAAQTKLKSSEEALNSSEEAFRLMQAKYENGKANITEFNESKNSLLKAQSDLVQARYEYCYQKALVNFYCGRPITF